MEINTIPDGLESNDAKEDHVWRKCSKEFPYPNNALVITTTTPDIYDKWLDYMGITGYEVYDKVTPDPAIESVESIQKQYEGKDVSCYIGLGGGAQWTCVNISAADRQAKDTDPNDIWDRS